MGDDYIQAKVLDDRINSDVDDDASNISSFIAVTKKDTNNSPQRHQITDQYSLPNSGLFEHNKSP